jgi:hypothetical protein
MHFSTATTIIQIALAALITLAHGQDSNYGDSCVTDGIDNNNILDAWCDDDNDNFVHTLLDLDFCLANLGGWLNVGPPFMSFLRFLYTLLI